MRLLHKSIRKRVDELRVSPNNVREDETTNLGWLERSIRETEGPTAPIVINQNDEIVAGRRRWNACKLAGIEYVDCIQYEFDSDAEEIIFSLVENEIRQPLSSVERRKAIEKLRSLGLSLGEISSRTGIPLEFIRGWIGQKWTPQKLLGDAVLDTTPSSKRSLVEKASSLREFRGDFEKLARFTEFAQKAPRGKVDEVLRKIQYGSSFDSEHIEKIEKGQTTTVKIEIDSMVYQASLRKCRQERLFFDAVVEKLLREWTGFEA